MPIVNPQKAAHLKVTGSDVGLGPVPALWSPTALGSDLLAWFDKRDGLTVDANGKLTAWASQVGGYSVVPNPSGGKPSVTVANGETTISFDAGTGGIKGSVLTTSSAPLNDAGVSIFAVAKRGVQADGTGSIFRPIVQAPVALRNNVRQIGFLGVFRPGSDAAQTALFAGQHVGTATNNSIVRPFAQDTKAIVSGDYPTAGPMAVRLDGGVPSATGLYYDQTDPYFSIGGAYASSDAAFVGQIDCVIVTKTGLSDATRQKLEGWLAWSFGTQGRFAATHPFALDGPYA